MVILVPLVSVATSPVAQVSQTTTPRKNGIALTPSANKQVRDHVTSGKGNSRNAIIAYYNIIILHYYSYNSYYYIVIIRSIVTEVSSNLRS